MSHSIHEKIFIKATPKFKKLSAKLMSDEALQDLINFLSIWPEKGKIIPQTGGFKKVAMANRQKQ